MEPTIVDEQAKGIASGTVPVETKIDISNDVMVVQINLKLNQVNCYGTLQFAMEMASRYYLTKQIERAKAAAEEDRSKLKVILPQGVKLR